MYNNQMPPCMMWNQMPQYDNMSDEMEEMEDKDLEMMYPNAYFKLMPMVKVHCDRLESKYGMFFCPSKEEIEDIVEDICKKHEKSMHEEEDKEKKSKKNKCRDEAYNEQFVAGLERETMLYRQGLLGDLAGILLINELIGRRRRRRRPHFGHNFGGHNHGGHNYGGRW